MYAVIQTGGKQYRVKEGDVLYVEKLSGEASDQVVFDQVLMIGGGDDPQIGAPVLEKARVACEILEQFRGQKVLVYKFKRRQKYRRRQGHRQHYTRLRVLEIAPNGKLVGKKHEKKTKAKENSAPIGFESTALDAQD